MQIDSLTLVAILGMAGVTYATRISGLWLMSRFTLSKQMKIWLHHIPGSVLVSIVAPIVFSSGLPEALAALVTVLVSIRTRNLLLAMVAGVGSVLGFRLLM